MTTPDPGAPTDPLAARPSPAEAKALADLVTGHEIFRAMPREPLADLIARGSRVSFAPGTFLMRRGEDSDFALILVDGIVEVGIDTGYDHVCLATTTAPAVVGEIGPFTGVARTANVKALTEVLAVRIAAVDLLRAGHAHPGFLSAVMHQIGRRFETFNRAIGFYSNALDALQRHDFDMRLLEDLRNPLPEFASFSHSFHRLAEEIMVRQAHRRDMASAAAIQRAMLPEPLEARLLGERVEIAAEMRPAQEVGGDFYDYFLLPDERLVLCVGDVSGKGVPASLFMSATQTALRYVLRHESDLAPAVTIVNRLLCATNRENMFVTLFCGVLDLRTGLLDYCNCGHGNALLLRAGCRIESPAVSSMALAVHEQAAFRAERLALATGDRLFVFTDGMTDAMNATEEHFGEARLETAVRAACGLASRVFIAELLAAVDGFCAGAPQFDDITALAVTIGAPGGAVPGAPGA